MIWGTALDNRDRQPEVMDQPGLDPREHAKALTGLRRINTISRCSAGLFRPIEALAIKQTTTPLRVLELACGGGDTAIDFALMAKQRGLALDIHACDLNPEAVEIARRNAKTRKAEITVFSADALAKPTDQISFDVVYCTLFAHHLDEIDVIRLLEGMALRSRKLVLVDDLIRSRLGFALACPQQKSLRSGRTKSYRHLRCNSFQMLTKQERPEKWIKSGLLGYVSFWSFPLFSYR